MDWKSGNDTILAFNELIQEKKYAPYQGKLKVGVDLGTANIVVAVVDENNRPVAGAMQGAHVVRDGIVVDYIGAVGIVKGLIRQIEEMMGIDLYDAPGATAIPPGIIERDLSNLMLFLIPDEALPDIIRSHDAGVFIGISQNCPDIIQIQFDGALRSAFQTLGGNERVQQFRCGFLCFPVSCQFHGFVQRVLENNHLSVVQPSRHALHDVMDLFLIHVNAPPIFIGDASYQKILQNC